MTKKLAALALALLFQTSAGAALADAGFDITPLNRAGEQRMLSQRIVKSYSQVGLNILPAVAATQLTAAISRFEANLNTLGATTKASPAASAAQARLARDWIELRRAAAGAISRETALAVSQQAEIVLASAENLTRIIEDEGKSVAARSVNLAGRQRMLSQRVAKAYMLRSWGVDSAALREEMESAVNEFSGGLAGLRARPDNSEEISRELEEIAQQWEWLQAALSVEGAASYRLIVAESADAILEASDRVTRLYEQQGRK